MFNDPHLRPLPAAHAANAPTLPALRVGMIGLGTVGTGVWQVLRRNQALIAARAGRRIEIVAVAVRKLPRAAALLGDAPGVLLTDDPLQVATHPGVDVVLELAGGTGPARGWVLAALAQGKHVVTANKALLAVHGHALFAAAAQHGVALAYEGAVAGSVPVIKALREGLAANRIDAVAGIINGTSNFILTRMRDAGVDFASALAEAQALGYAEADPAFDVDGVDAAHKLALLAANAFGTPVRFDAVHVEGIRALQALDVAAAAQLGYTVKLLGIARRQPGGVELRVHPTLLPAHQLLAQVDGAMNGVLVHGDAAGPALYCGAGAGGEQTASAVIADLVDVARLPAHGGNAQQRVPALGFHAAACADLPVLPMAEVVTPHYLRLPLPASRAGVPEADVTQALAQLLHDEGVQAERLDGYTDSSQPTATRHLLLLTQPVADAVAARVADRLQYWAQGAVVRLRVAGPEACL